MQILEWSDTRVRFKIREIENNITYDFDLTEFTWYKLEIRFADDSLIEIDWVVDDWTIYFDIFSEYTDWKEWAFVADIWWVKWVKKVRFNPTTIKGKVLDSVYIPQNVVQEP
jgi:hypothetical protein